MERPSETAPPEALSRHRGLYPVLVEDELELDELVMPVVLPV